MIFKSLSDNFKSLVNQLFGRWTVAQNDPTTVAYITNEVDSSKKQLALNFFTISQTKDGIIKDIDRIKDFYFSQFIVERIIDDALNPTSDGQLFSVKVIINDEEDESLTKLLEDFIDEFNIEKVLKDIAYDLLYYGEYYLRLSVKSIYTSPEENGVINIHDDVDIAKIVPIFRDSNVSGFLKLEKNEDNKLHLVTKSPSEYVYFSLPGNRIRVKMQTQDDKVTYIRMGKSVLYPVYGLLQELMFFENIVPIKFIQNAMRTKLVSVSVPANTKPQEAQKIAKTFEKLINNTLTLKTPNNPTEEIIRKLQEKAGEVKVIPNWGDKGQLEAQDFTSEDDFDQLFEKIQDIRKLILSTIGIPTSIIEDENIKADIIRQNVRYSKKLKSIQDALAEGLKTLFIIHLHNKGFTNILKENIQISFLNILNLDDLEKLEYVDLMVSMLQNFNDYLMQLNEEKVDIDYENYVDFINTTFHHILGYNIISVKEQSNDQEENM